MRATLHNCTSAITLIAGCKLNNVPIVYTPWSNLRKTHDMAVGQVRLTVGAESAMTL